MNSVVIFDLSQASWVSVERGQLVYVSDPHKTCSLDSSGAAFLMRSHQELVQKQAQGLLQVLPREQPFYRVPSRF